MQWLEAGLQFLTSWLFFWSLLCLGCFYLGSTQKSRLLNKSVSQFSHSVVSDSLWPHERQHTRPPCPSPTPGVYSNSCPLSQWWYSTISSSVVPFSSCPQSCPASGFFQLSQLFASGGQSTGVQLQHQSFQWIFRTDFLQEGLVGSPCCPRDSRESSPTTQFKIINSLVLSFLHRPVLTSIYDHWKNHSLD